MRIPRTAGRNGDAALGTITWAVIALGVVLRCISYARRSVLWTDEAALAGNIMERSLSDLLTIPLDYGQAAPKGFLLLEWLVTRAFGTSDLAFRLVPFVSAIVSLFLFAAIARRLLTPSGALGALLFFSVGYWFLVYASDTHPYGLDLALSLAALLVCIDLRRLAYPAQRVWAAGLFGAVAVWFSNAALVALFGLGVALGAIAWRERGWRAAVRALWPIAAMWSASAAAAAWVAVHGMFPTTREYLAWWWRDAMMPVLRSPAAFRWLWDAWRIQLLLFHGWSVENPVWTSLYVALALIGFVSLLMRRAGEAILAASVVAAYAVVSMAKQYPYEARLVLASIAVFVLGIGESIGQLARAEWGRVRVVPRLLAVLVCLPPIYRIIAFPPPYQWSVTGSYLAQIRDRWQPGDIVYSTYGTAFELVHSAPHFGLRAEDYVLGPCDLSDPRRSLQAADALRGRRAWVIVGTGRYFPESPEYGYLRTIGLRGDSLPVRLPGSFRAFAPVPFDIPTAYLFDLRDTTRLAHATADTYVLSPLLRRAGRRANDWNCYGVWRPLHRESGIGGAPESRASGNREPGTAPLVPDAGIVWRGSNLRMRVARRAPTTLD